MGAEPVELWHADADLKGSDAVIVPGGFSYGDYLRPGAIARFANVMAPLEDFARSGGPILGVCNGFQVLTEAHLLPGALLRNTACASSAAHPRAGGTIGLPGPPHASRVRSSRSRSRITRVTTSRTPRRSVQLEDEDRVVLRYLDNPNASMNDIAGSATRQERGGDHASPRAGLDPLLGSEERDEDPALHARGGEGLNIQETYSTLGLSDFETTASLSFWGGRRTTRASRLRNVERALRLQEQPPAPETLPELGTRRVARPRRERGVEVGDGWALAFKVRATTTPRPSSPTRGRPRASAASSGTYPRDGREAGCAPRLSEVRAAGRGKEPLPVWRSGARYRGLRERRWRADGRGWQSSRGRTRQPARERDVRRAHPHRGPRPLLGPPEKATWSSSSARRPGATAYTAPPSPRRADGRVRVQEVERPGRDPFAEKMLIECCLKLLEEGPAGLSPGPRAAGITSSASEMAAKGGVGIEIEADRVPLRESGMEPYEVVISESQERMLAVVEPEKAKGTALAERYGLVGAVIGRVAGHGELRVKSGGEVVGSVPAEHLADAPLYERTWSVPPTSTRYKSSKSRTSPSREITTRCC